jgi:hypothetical protein
VRGGRRLAFREPVPGANEPGANELRVAQICIDGLVIRVTVVRGALLGEASSCPLWHTGAIMLIEIWEHLRGYDKWIQTDATILSSELIDPVIERPQDGSLIIRNPIGNPFAHWLSKCGIRWTDPSGVSHTANYSVYERSRLFLLYEGQTVSIRFNPVRPAEFYLRPLYLDRLSSMLLSKLWLVCIAIPLLMLAHYLFELPAHLRR